MSSTLAFSCLGTKFDDVRTEDDWILRLGWDVVENNLILLRKRILKELISISVKKSYKFYLTCIFVA